MAQAILLQDVDTLGGRGEVIDVSPGYLRNFLVPRKLAQPATPGAIAEAERRREAAERAASEAAERAQENIELLTRTVLTIPQPAGDDGRLFGSVTAADIVEAIRQARGIKLDRRKVDLEHPIKTTGTHMVTVEVSEGAVAEVKTIVTPE
jgi:large subunit ribosomal protein L9